MLAAIRAALLAAAAASVARAEAAGTQLCSPPIRSTCGNARAEVTRAVSGWGSEKGSEGVEPLTNP